MQQEVERLRDFHLLALLDTGGRFYTNQGKTGDARDREFFRQAMQGRLYISDPIVSRSTGVRQVSIAAPIRGDAAKAVQGAIAGPIPIDRLTQIVEALNYGPRQLRLCPQQRRGADRPAARLARERQRVRHQPDRTQRSGLAGACAEDDSGQATIDRFELDGQPSYVAYFPLQQADWSIALVIPRRNIEAALRPLEA